MRVIFIWVSFILITAACAPAAPVERLSADELPAGNAAHGAELFTESVNGAPACSTCHTLTDTTLVGPGLEGYAERAGTRIDGISATEYTYASIVQPATHIVSGFSNSMYNQYGRQLDTQQIADLIAYLLTL